jgi:hypothetical protein
MKFFPKFVGLYQVVKKVCETTYFVEDLPLRRKKKEFKRFDAHVCQIRRFHARDDVEWELVEHSDAGEKEEGSSESEKVSVAINNTEQPEFSRNASSSRPPRKDRITLNNTNNTIRLREKFEKNVVNFNI